MEFDIRSYVHQSLSDVFATMLSMDISVADRDLPDPDDTHRMVGAVDFTGDLIGGLHIQVTTDFAHRMTARVLGLEVEEVEGQEDVKNLIAEISHIMGANLRSAFSDHGLHCVISTACIISGTDFAIESPKMPLFERVVFLHEQERIILEVGVKSRETSAAGAEMQMAAVETPAKDVDFEKLNTLDLQAKLSEAVVAVFNTMLSMELELIDTVSASPLDSRRKLGAVSFAGDVSGMLSIQVADDLARITAANRLDMDPSEIQHEKEVKDRIGELCSTVGANLKSVITDAGLTCELSIPRLTSGTDFEIECLNMERYARLAFRHQDHVGFVEMGIKVSDILRVAGQMSQDVPQAVDQRTAAVGEQVPPPPGPGNPAAGAAADNASPKRAPGKQGDESGQRHSSDQENYDLNLILDIPLEILVELGRTKIQIHDLLQLKQGSAVKLSKLDSAPVDILANDMLIARGVVVIQNEKYAVRVTEIASRMDRIKSLN